MASEGKLCVVIGAAGRLGRALVDKALERGMRVRALVRLGRTCSALSERQGVEMMEVNLEDPSSLEAGFTGADVIFCAIRGKSGFKNYHDMSRYVRNIVEAMINDDYDLKVGVDRLILCSCLSTSEEGRSRMSFFSKLNSQLFKCGHVADFAEMERSSLDDTTPDFFNKMSIADFTIVRPTTLTDAADSSHEVVGYQPGEMQRILSSIPRRQLASYMFTVCYENGGFSRDSVMVGLKP